MEYIYFFLKFFINSYLLQFLSTILSYNKIMRNYPEILKRNNIEAFFTEKIKNFEQFKNSLPIMKLYMPIQRHTDLIIVLRCYTKPAIADAIITDQREIFIGIKTADCLPVLIFDPENNIIGAVHAGWRGTAKGILKKTIIKMNEIYGCNPENLLIAMGPCIKGCCYEVGEEVLEALKRETPAEDYILKRNGRIHVDLSIANMLQVLVTGVKKENIWISEDCTYCKHDHYASYRFYGKTAEKQYGIIGML